MPVIFAAGPAQHLAALERRLFRLGQRTGTLVHAGASPSGNEPFDDPAHFGDLPLVVHSDGGDWGGWVHAHPDTDQNG